MSTDEISNRRCRWLLNQRRFWYWREAEIGEILALHDKRPDFLVGKLANVVAKHDFVFGERSEGSGRRNLQGSVWHESTFKKKE